MSRQHVEIARQWRRWQQLRRAAFTRDGFRCTRCGKAGRLEADHTVPIAKGGPVWDLGNISTLCRYCHIAKTAEENVADYRLEWRRRVASLSRQHG